MQSSIINRPVYFHRQHKTLKQLKQRVATTVTVATAEEVEVSGQTNIRNAVSTLKLAVSDSSVAPQEILASFMTLDKAKLDPEGWFDIIGGSDREGGNRWRLIFVSSQKDITNARKKNPTKGGKYVPLTAVNSFDAKTKRNKNGIFLGWLGSLTFGGPIEWKGRKLEFDVDRTQIKIGPFSFGFDSNVQEQKKKQKVQPFFVFLYVDEDIIVARGATGGTALWGRTTTEWEIQNGVIQ
eukprot:TRINITY_DN6701_c0_g1_i4.p1 TRINITY_DN6701_c0_g1~~TRINITY_DN6701_c0_g1_i4.p1  ORF type:complete len:238 (-),score=33.17 TRINITY_DN6701_c0_g1_i4:132-845(-)